MIEAIEFSKYLAANQYTVILTLADIYTIYIYPYEFHGEYIGTLEDVYNNWIKTL